MAPPPSPRSRRLLGQYFTTGNPFTHPAFAAWWQDTPSETPVLEPFAGANGLPTLLRASGFERPSTSYDIEPQAPDVHERDTLASFPSGFDTVVTNPPYLAKHFARRKGLEVDHLPWGEYRNLYQVAMATCLAHAPYVAGILPDSYVTSGLFRDRLRAVITLDTPMFDDTTTPTCLALWGPTATEDFDVWRGLHRAGRYSDLAVHAPAPVRSEGRITFNRPDGQLGLRLVDNSSSPSIEFIPAHAVPSAKVTGSSRLLTRVHVKDLHMQDVSTVMTDANRDLAAYRQKTADVLLTAFKGLRRDGHVRRRIDFTTARRLLAGVL